MKKKSRQKANLRPKQAGLGKKSLANKIFFLVFGLLIAGSVAITYWRIMVKRDYIISAQQDCDPAAENCFVYECDPEDPEDPECASLPEEERTTYYKIIQKNAKNIPPCDPYENECPETLACEEDEEECEFELCDEENVPEGESCNNPEEYLAENPPEEDCECGEEETESSPSDEEETKEEVDTVPEDEEEVSEETDSSCSCPAPADSESPPEETNN